MTTNNKLNQSLGEILASSVELYFVYKGYHWNLEKTPLFYSLHELFDKHAASILQAVDMLAERLRFLGQKVAFSLSSYQNSSILDSGASENDSMEQMLSNLQKLHEVYIQKLEQIIKEAEQVDDFGTADMLTELLREQQQMLWFIRSSI